MKTTVKILAGALLAVATAGCGLVIDRNADFRREYLRTAHVPPSTAGKIKSGAIAKGMTQDQVQAAWGAPTAKSSTSYGSRWFWDNRILLSQNLNGRVVKFNHAGQVFEWQQPE